MKNKQKEWHHATKPLKSFIFTNKENKVVISIHLLSIFFGWFSFTADTKFPYTVHSDGAFYCKSYLLLQYNQCPSSKISLGSILTLKCWVSQDLFTNMWTKEISFSNLFEPRGTIKCCFPNAGIKLAQAKPLPDTHREKRLRRRKGMAFGWSQIVTTKNKSIWSSFSIFVSQ